MRIFLFIMKKIIFLFFFLPFMTACHISGSTSAQLGSESPDLREELLQDSSLERATFAGGCFWCMEGPFESQDGVKEAFAGYTGGEQKNPTYEQISTGTTKHRESVDIFYDPESISYDELLTLYWEHIDPTDPEGQFSDKGEQYKTAIYFHNDDQKKSAEASKEKLQNSGKFEKDIVTDIFPAQEFYLAEEYHQNYYKKQSKKYEKYSEGSGRAPFLREQWGEDFEKPSDEELRTKLTPLQYSVTQEEDTEKPFMNTYWDNKEKGIYVDLISGEALFSSLDKFVSGTGWPSFTKPLDKENIVEKKDNRIFFSRTEIRSNDADSHLGHLFPDGPEDKGGLRYCINSAALRFVPVSDMKKEGYEEYISLFRK